MKDSWTWRGKCRWCSGIHRFLLRAGNSGGNRDITLLALNPAFFTHSALCLCVRNPNPWMAVLSIAAHTKLSGGRSPKPLRGRSDFLCHSPLKGKGRWLGWSLVSLTLLLPREGQLSLQHPLLGNSNLLLHWLPHSSLRHSWFWNAWGAKLSWQWLGGLAYDDQAKCCELRLRSLRQQCWYPGQICHNH